MFFDIVESADGERVYLECILKYPFISLSLLPSFRQHISLTNHLSVIGYPERSKSGALILSVRSLSLLRSFDADPSAVGNVRLANKFNQGHYDKEREEERLLALLHEHIEHCSTADKVPLGTDEWEKPLCKAWRKGLCKREEEKCGRRHRYLNEREREKYEWLVKRQKIEREKHNFSDDPLSHSSKKGRGERAKIFAQWLVEAFGREWCERGSGVLDIAGGRGDVAFELHTKMGIPCTLIEPRPLKLNKKQHRYLKERRKEREKERERDEEKTENEKQREREREREMDICPQITDLFDENLLSLSSPHSPTIHNASVLIGMHPDQVTEPIVDGSLSLSKPFAVVPCCVFPLMFPHRRTPNGDEVVSCSQFIEYLKEKHEGIETAFLPFEGRNQVVYLSPTNLERVERERREREMERENEKEERENEKEEREKEKEKERDMDIE